ncbi:MAG: GAF domain-containing protein [Gaiellaceae bacterium]
MSEGWVVFCQVCHIELARIHAMGMTGGAVLDYSHLRECRHVDMRQLEQEFVDVIGGRSTLPVSVAEAATARPLNEQERLAAVRRYNVLDTPREGAFDRVAAVAARVFDVPISTVTIVDEDRIWFKATYGLEVTQIDRDPGLCASTVCQNGPWVVEDALRDPLALNNSLVRGELQLRYYAAAPIITSDGYRLGTVNVIDRKPRETSDSELATLQDLAAIVSDALEVRLAARDTLKVAEGLGAPAQGQGQG